MPHLTVRLPPGAHLRPALAELARAHQLRAAWIATCVGSLTDVHLRYADRAEGVRLGGPFEIVGLVGTFSVAGAHLHLAVADGEGRVVGGHVLETGNRIYTTAEVVIGYSDEEAYTRVVDAATGYRELVIRREM